MCLCIYQEKKHPKLLFPECVCVCVYVSAYRVGGVLR